MGVSLATSPTLIDHYTAVILSSQDYFCFGSPMPGRSFSSGSYRYGFNGKELDKEFGEGDYDFGARIYSSRLGRFYGFDPRGRSFPYWSSYAYAGNTPIRLVDKDGEGPGDPPNYSIGFSVHIGRFEQNFKFYAAIAHHMALVNGVLGGEGGGRIDAGAYTSKWGQKKIGVDASFSAYIGLNAGNPSNVMSTGMLNSTLEFMGSGIHNSKGGGALGISQSYLVGSKVGGENINQVIGGFYARGDWDNLSLRIGHMNDLFGIKDGGDGDEGASGFALTSYYAKYGEFQTGYTFRIVNPQPKLDHEGEREVDGKGISSKEGQYKTEGSHGIYFQTSNFFVRFSNGSVLHEVAIGTANKWTQVFWQNHLAHKDGNKYPTFNNTGKFKGLNIEYRVSSTGRKIYGKSK